jgi:tRNA(Arg) A34 adenosine deaminase TadA
MQVHAQYIAQCHVLAQKAAAEGESPVGSIIVKNGQVIGEAYEKSRQLNDITRHAEMLALLQALTHTPDIAGAALYSNVEPCILCAYAIRHYRIAQVVFTRPAGQFGAANGIFNVLTTRDVVAWGPPPAVVVLPAG